MEIWKAQHLIRRSDGLQGISIDCFTDVYIAFEADQRIKELEAERDGLKISLKYAQDASQCNLDATVRLRSTIAALLERMEIVIAETLIEGEWSAPQPDEIDPSDPDDGWNEMSSKIRAAKKMAEIRKEMGLDNPGSGRPVEVVSEDEQG